MTLIHEVSYVPQTFDCKLQLYTLTLPLYFYSTYVLRIAPLHRLYSTLSFFSQCFYEHLQHIFSASSKIHNPSNMMRLKAIAIALALHLPATYAADRLRGSSSQQEAVVTASTVEEAPSNEIDVQSAGIDRSLASIHESELSFLNDEQVEALGEYITRYSKDGNTDIPETCPFDYEGDVDPYHPDSYTTLSENGRSLMGEMDMEQEIAHAHAHTHYIESNCNSMLNMTTCMNWTQWVDINNITMSSEVR